MDRKDAIGAGQVAAGGVLAYKSVEHGLPRALGIRNEYHVTSKENAVSIKKNGNKLLPEYGGKNGWAAKIRNDNYVKNSTGFVHITGFHADSKNLVLKKGFQKIPFYFRTMYRNIQKIMYKTLGNGDASVLDKLMNPNSPIKEKLVTMFDVVKQNIFKNKTKTFCIPGIDSHFNKNFIADSDDVALKSSKAVKVYNNRFSAMIAGLKEFGLKGMKENKSRVAVGIGILTLGIAAGVSLIKKGINNINQKNVN